MRQVIAQLVLRGLFGWAVMGSFCGCGTPEYILVDTGKEVSIFEVCGGFTLFPQADAIREQMLREHPELARQRDPHSQDTPLHAAAESGNLAALKDLLAAGAEPNARDEFGHTALGRAAQTGKYDAAERLLQHGADPNIAADHGGTPIYYAAMRGDEAMLFLLWRHGSKLEYSIKEAHGPRWSKQHVLMTLIRCYRYPAPSRVQAVSRLMQTAKLKPNLMLDAEGSSPLEAAVDAGDLYTVQWLVENGALLYHPPASNRRSVLEIARKMREPEWEKRVFGKLEYHEQANYMEAMNRKQVYLYLAPAMAAGER